MSMIANIYYLQDINDSDDEAMILLKKQQYIHIDDDDSNLSVYERWLASKRLELEGVKKYYKGVL